MPIQMICSCGKRLLAREEHAGKRTRCPVCGNSLRIPAAALSAMAAQSKTAAPPEPAYDVPDDPLEALAQVIPPQPAPGAKPSRRPKAAAPRAAAAKHSPVVRARPGGIGSQPFDPRRYFYMLLALALIPLVYSTLIQGYETRDDLQARMEKTKSDNPDAAAKIHALGDRAPHKLVLMQFPDHRLEGAVLPVDTWVHWLLALVSGALFMWAILAIFPGVIDKPGQLAWTALFTATIGIFILFLFQLVPILQLYYLAALDPHTSFAISCLGFTLGIGLCEEFCKAIPVLYLFNSDDSVSWRAACMVGFASGLGFGLSEAIKYCADFYNGVMGSEIYFVRFISCVVLHALWTGGVAITLYRRQKHLQESTGWDWFWTAIALLLVPMMLHGLYDTMLKKDHEFGALVIALVTFGWFAFQVETARRGEEAGEETFNLD